MSFPALLLDRDGVINKNYGYVHKPECFHFVDGIFNLARGAHEKGYKIVVITNQAGIGRGYYTEDQFHQLTAWMCRKFLSNGVPISGVYFSPYHPTEGLGCYLRDDVSRKPRPGMVLQAQQDLSLDLKHSVLVGDKASDILAGLAAGVGTNLLFSAARPSELSDAHYEIISTLEEVIPFLRSLV